MRDSQENILVSILLVLLTVSSQKLHERQTHTNQNQREHKGAAQLLPSDPGLGLSFDLTPGDVNLLDGIKYKRYLYKNKYCIIACIKADT